MSEEFVINDIRLKVNPTDITTVQKRNVASSEFIRDDSSYAFKSKFAYTSFNVIMAFNVHDSGELDNLVRLCTELDGYPFAFIRSDRMETHLSHTFSGSNDYHIYGVEEYEISQHSETQGVVYLRLNLLFFNYIPFAKSFGFKGLREINARSTFSANSQSGNSKAGESLYAEVETYDLGAEWNSQSRVGSVIEEETVISLFKRLFRKEYLQRKAEVLKYGSKDRPFSFLSMASPSISSSKPAGYDDLKAQGFGEDYEVTTTAGLTTKKLDAPDIPGKTTIYTTWNHVVDKSGNKINFNTGNGEMVRVTVAKKNNFAVHHLSGYNHPVLQYMGKGSSTHSIDFELSTGLNPSPDNTDSNLSHLKNVFNTIDTNFSRFRGMDSFNVAKIETFLLSLIPSYGYVLDQENIFAHATDQGKEVYSYVLRESDTRSLMDRSRYNDAGNKETDFTVEVMADIIKKVYQNFKDSGGLDVTATYVERGFLENAQGEVTALSANLFVAAASQVKDYLHDTHGEQLYDTLFALNESLVEMDEGIILKAAEGEIGRINSRGRIVGGVSTRTILDRHRADLDPKNFENISRMLNKRINDPGKLQTRDLLLADREIQTAFRKIIELRALGNPFTAPAQEYVDLLKNNYDGVVEDFSDEGYADLRLDERLGITSGSLLKWKIDDPRDLDPFFFLNQNIYTNAKGMKSVYDVTAQVSSSVIADAQRKTGDLIEGEDLQVQHVKVKTPELIKDNPHGEISEETLETIKKTGSVTGELLLPNDEEDVFTTFSDSNIDPFNERDQALYQTARMAKQFETGMNQAWPTLRVFIVEGDESSPLNKLRLRKHNYYEVKGIIGCDVITNDDESPVDYLMLDLANPGNTYTDGHVMHSVNKSIKNQDLLNTIGENQFSLNKLTLRPGNRLHVKAGYDNNINKLETIFNGVITDIEPHDSGETKLRVNAESFGRELLQYRHGDDPGDDLFWLSATTKKIISHCLYYPEIEHFGTIKFGAVAGEDPEAKRIYTLSAFGMAKTRLFTNIYTNEILNDLFDFGQGKDQAFNVNLGNIISTTEQVAYDFPIYQATPWESLKEMEFRHPGTLSKPVNYGDRMSYFFGIKEQLYVHRDLAAELMMDSSVVRNIFGPGGMWDDDFKDSGSLYTSLRFLRFKPVCDFHILSSDHNIIHNGLKVTDDFNTVVNLQYYGDQSDIEDGDFDYYEMKVDDNIIPSEHRRGDFSSLGMHGKYMAYKYGSVYLRREMEKMYDGVVTVLGNPSIKGGDYASMHDDLRMLSGIVKVRKCVHSFSLSNGYVCKITPGLYAESSQFNYSTLFLKLFMSADRAMAVNKMNMQVNNQSSSALIRLKTAQEEYLSKSSGVIGDPEIIAYALGSSAAVGATGYGIYRSAMNASNPNLLQSAVRAGSGMGSSILNADKTVLKNGISRIASLANSSVPAQMLSSKLPKSVATARFLGHGAMAALSGASSAFGYAAGLMTPIGWTVGIVGILAYSKYEEADMTRQPIRMYPLQLNGVPYVGGVGGWEDNSYFESIGSELSKTLNDFKYLIGVVNNVK